MLDKMNMLLRRGAMRFLNFDAAAGFAMWREAAGIWRRERFLIARCVARIRNKTLLQALSELREFTEFKRIEELEFQMFLTKKHLPGSPKQSPTSSRSAPARLAPTSIGAMGKVEKGLKGTSKSSVGRASQKSNGAGAPKRRPVN